MKITRLPSPPAAAPFQPISLRLESPEELHQFIALVSDRELVAALPFLDPVFDALQKLGVDDQESYKPWFDRLLHMFSSYDPRATAPGHNPNGLTNAQVDVPDGWRLLHRDEISDFNWSTPCEQWISDRNPAWCAGGRAWRFDFTYRTRSTKAELAKLRVPWNHSL